MAGILQDSVQDWADQASQMGEIFSNAYLTIAASASENGQQGLVSRRRATQKLDVVHNGKAFVVYARHAPEHEFRAHATGLPFMGGATQLPLRKRAWCFQEELLSKRIIHFTQDESVFVCQEATTCECNLSGRPRFVLPRVVGTDLRAASRIWKNIVEHYTGRQISFCKDRLPALSSLTHLFEEGSGRYLAGLWESHLPGSLLWLATCGRRLEQEQHSQCRPPSWSWASIEGELKHPQDYRGYGQKDVAEVLDVRTYPSTVDPRGMVSGGQITLRGPLFPLQRTWKRHETPWDEFLERHIRVILFDSCFACTPGWTANHPWLEQEHCYCVLDDPTDSMLLLPNHVIDAPIFLSVIRTIKNSKWDVNSLNPYPKGCCFLGLLLQPLEDLNQIQAKIMKDSESKLSFVRVGFGMMCLSKEDSDEALYYFGNTTVTIF